MLNGQLQTHACAPPVLHDSIAVSGTCLLLLLIPLCPLAKTNLQSVTETMSGYLQKLAVASEIQRSSWR